MTGSDWSALRHQVATIQAVLKKRYDAPALDQTLGDLVHLQKLFDDSVYDESQIEELRCIGAVFGNVVQKQLVFEWVCVERRRDREPALQLKTQPALVVFPLTMVVERLQSGVAVNLGQMFRSVKEEVAQTRIL
jgi:hypothetical protein